MSCCDCRCECVNDDYPFVLVHQQWHPDDGLVSQSVLGIYSNIKSAAEDQAETAERFKQNRIDWMVFENDTDGLTKEELSERIDISSANPWDKGGLSEVIVSYPFDDTTDSLLIFETEGLPAYSYRTADGVPIEEVEAA